MKMNMVLQTERQESNAQPSISHPAVPPVEQLSPRMSALLEVCNYLQEFGPQLTPMKMCAQHARMREQKLGRLGVEVKSNKLLFILDIESSLSREVRAWKGDKLKAGINTAVTCFAEGRRLVIVHKFDVIDPRLVVKSESRHMYRDLEQKLDDILAASDCLKIAPIVVPGRDRIGYHAYMKINDVLHMPPDTQTRRGGDRTKIGAVYRYLRYAFNQAQFVVALDRHKPDLKVLLEAYLESASLVF